MTRRSPRLDWQYVERFLESLATAWQQPDFQSYAGHFAQWAKLINVENVVLARRVAPIRRYLLQAYPPKERGRLELGLIGLESGRDEDHVIATARRRIVGLPHTEEDVVRFTLKRFGHHLVIMEEAASRKRTAR